MSSQTRTPSPPTLRDIYAARRRIAPLIQRTPLIRSEALSARTGRNVYLKLENVQQTGAFKLRGAANRLLTLSAEERARGVVTVSTGNHGRAVAYVGRQLGVPVTVCVPDLVLPHKIAAMEALGARIVVQGRDQEEAESHALALGEREGLVSVSPFDEPDIIAGQGTIGLELLEDLPQLDTLISPLSGGGLMGGIALALKSADAAIRTVGVAMERGPAMIESIRAGHVVPVDEQPSLADSLIGGIGPENRYTFAINRALVDECVTLSEEEIAAAMRFAFEEEHLVLEGGGSVGIGALLHDKVADLGEHIAVVVSGGNVDINLLKSIINGEWREE